MRRSGFALVVLIALTVAIAHAQTRKAPATAPVPFTTALTPEQMAHKQAVVETTQGTFVIALLADAAPNHVGYFMKLVQDGTYAGTTFHRAVRMAIVQGGDPLSKDPSKASLVGTGGFGALKAEFNSTPMVRGAVAAVLQPGRPDSGGAQFFIAVSDQLALNGQYTVYGQVVEGLEVVRKISEAPVDAQGRRLRRRSRSVRKRWRSYRSTAPFSKRQPEISPSHSGPTRRPSTCATSCDSPPPVCTTGRPSTASSTAS